MKAHAKGTFLFALSALATAIPGTRISAAPNPQVKSGVDYLYVIDCRDGSGLDESRWTPGVNVGTPVGFTGHCYLIHHSQGWFLWDTGIDDAVAQLNDGQIATLPKATLWFNASGMGGRCSPSPSLAYGTRIRSLKGFWHRP